MENNVNKKIKAYALKDAVEHKGKALEKSIISALFHEGLKKEDIKKTIKKIQETIKKINSMSLEDQKKEFEKYSELISKRKERQGLPELPNTKKGIIMRFSPSPSGPMHIGHVLTSLPSALYVNKYKGKFILRIEDTNPKNIYTPAYKMIEQEAKWLFEKFCKINKISIQSKRIEIYYKYIEKLINSKNAYVCDCNPEEFKELIQKRKPCPCRKISVKENFERWEKMLDKKGYKEGEVVLRFKSDFKLENPALIDFPLARIIESEHPLQKNKYRVWPLMNLSVTVDDIEEKITHIIRAKEHRENAKRQEMIMKSLNIKNIPWTSFLGRYHFKDLELSTTKTKKAIEEGKYTGWDDPRLPFVSSLKKQGYQQEAFAKMVEQRGLSEVDKIIDKKEFFRLLDYFNRQVKNSK